METTQQKRSSKVHSNTIATKTFWIIPETDQLRESGKMVGRGLSAKLIRLTGSHGIRTVCRSSSVIC